jgi:hypothetical protein
MRSAQLNRKLTEPKLKTIPVTGIRDPSGFETRKLSNVILNGLTDSAEVVSLTHQLPSSMPTKIPSSKRSNIIGDINRDLPATGIRAQNTKLQRGLTLKEELNSCPVSIMNMPSG